MDFVEVDGSEGEGGGQILRTAVAFSAVRRVPVRVTRIREGREDPGLKRQHVSALRILAKVFSGELHGAEEGSATVTFTPGSPSLGSLSVDMGTAASITLVLQAVIPAVALSGARLSIHLVGGTDVPWSPTFDYLQRVAIPGYGALGIHASVTASQRGYYPRGGGMVAAEVETSAGVRPLDLVSREKASRVKLVSRCGGLSKAVAERQTAAASAVLAAAGYRVDAETRDGRSASPGTSVLVYCAVNGALLGSDSLGARGRPAEDVGREAARRFVAAEESGGCLDANLADMLLPLLTLAPGPSRVKIPEVTAHLESGMRLASQFTPCRWSSETSGSGVLVTVNPEAV